MQTQTFRHSESKEAVLLVLEFMIFFFFCDLQTFINLHLGNLWQLLNEIIKCTCKVDIF